MPVPGKRDELYPGPGLSDPFAQCESDRTTESASIFDFRFRKPANGRSIGAYFKPLYTTMRQ